MRVELFHAFGKAPLGGEPVFRHEHAHLALLGDHLDILLAHLLEQRVFESGQLEEHLLVVLKLALLGLYLLVRVAKELAI